MTKEQFKQDFTALLIEKYAKPVDDITEREKYNTLVDYIMNCCAVARKETSLRHIEEQAKKIYYFSMEFLIGPLLENYLIYLGIKDAVEEGLKELDTDLDSLLKLDPDPGLGNGGLGRLAACFLDSMASLGVPGVGMGIRYRYGLFRQHIKSGYQYEEADDWLSHGYHWAKQKSGEGVDVHFGGYIEKHFNDGRLSFEHKGYDTVRALPYDVPIVSYGGEVVNVLKLWSAKVNDEYIDLEAFNKGDYSGAMKQRNDAEAISHFLYPNDNQEAGKVLRLKQEYFLACAGMSSIFTTYKNNYGDDWEHFPDRVSIHTNDTHPALCVPELMRRLVDEENIDWDKAWDITCRTISYTNHTVMPEALERWPKSLIESMLPRISMIIEEIDRRWRMRVRDSGRADLIQSTSVFDGNDVRMANLSIIGAHAVNGVAALHTEIIKKDVFPGFCELDPWKFSNKTNGISHRRFLIQSNPGLASLITEAIGDGWQRDFDRLGELEKFKDDAAFLEKLSAVKRQNKLRLAAYVADRAEMALDPDSIFDVHVKRIHAYKRQLLKALQVLDLYLRYKDDPGILKTPCTFIFAGKAAAGYAFAKEVIKFICSVADIINADPDASKVIKVVFVENLCVSNAQLIYPAADISEQISTAGKEASGTGNMKFMMNGAVTLGTMDGANIEIFDLVGKENMQIFGINAEEARDLTLYGAYDSQAEIAAEPRIGRLVNSLVNGFFAGSGCDFWGIYDEIVSHNDQFFVIKDLMPYIHAWEDLNDIYLQQSVWRKMSLTNIARSAFFSSDRTIREYVRDIWHTPCM